MKSNFKAWVRPIAVLVVGFCTASCGQHSRLIPESEYSTKIVGRWEGTVGDSKENMSLNGDGTFVCELHRTGFIARTFSPGVTGTIRGTWKITGAVITLRVTSAEKENLRNRITSSTIEAFKGDELVLKSDRGETSPFERVRAL